MARSRSSGRPWLWPASRKFVPSLPWTSRTPPNAWPPASFPSWKLCEFIPISAASALNPASVNSSSAALRIPSSIASAPTALSSPPSPTPPNLDKLPSPHVPRSKERSFDSLRSLRMTILRRMVRCRGRRLGRFDPAHRSRSPPLLVVIPNEVRDLLFPCSPLVYPEPRRVTRHCLSPPLFVFSPLATRHSPLLFTVDARPSGRRPAARHNSRLGRVA